MKGHQNLSEMQVYSCTFQVIVNQATMAIKFPCTYTVEIKSMNNKLTMATTKNKVSAVDSVAVFNEALKFETELLYNTKIRQFNKKDVLVLLNLISTRKPDQQKLVGRVILDLSQSITSTIYSQPQQYKLDYCSVNANITFSVRFMGKKQSSTLPENFDRDSFSDFQSFVAGIHKEGGGTKQRSFEQSEKTLEMPWKTKNNEGFDRNKIIEQSNNQDAQSRINTGRTSHKLLGSNENIPKPSSPKNQMFALSKLDEGHESHKNLIQNVNSPSRSIYSDRLPTQQQESSRVKSDNINKSNASQKGQTPSQNYQPSILSQPINQYEEILRSSHAQEKRIWDEEKRLLNEQILRQKQQNFKQKEKNQSLEKKAYEAELKLGNIEGKIENSKREMAILEREKDLEIKDLKSKLERAVKQKSEKTQQFEVKQVQLRQMKEIIRNLQNEKRRTQQELNKQQQKMHEKVEVALKRVMSSEELVSKLQKERKENCDTLLQTEKKNIQLIAEINQLKSKLDKSSDLQLQLNKLKNEKSLGEKKFNELQQQLKSEHERQKNQLLGQIEALQTKSKANTLQQEQKLKNLKDENNLEVTGLNQKIEELKSLISENELKQHDLYLKLVEKGQEVQRINGDMERKLKQAQKQNQKHFQSLLTENKKQIQHLARLNEDLQKQKRNLQQNLQLVETQLSIKNGQLVKLNNQAKEDQKLKQGKQKENKQYVQSLEKQILSLSEQLNEKVRECDQLNGVMETMKNSIKEMKVYEKGLQEELLNMHENNLQGEFNDLIEKEKRLNSQFEAFKISADQTIRQLETNVQDLNDVIISRNREIQNLSSQKNETKEYILSLQTQILKYSAESEEGLKLNDRLVRMQQQILQLKQENKEKDSEIDGVKMINIQLKEYQIGLEQQILKTNEEIQSLITNKNNHEGAQINYSPEKPILTFDQKQKLHRKIRELERTLQDKKIYERQLEQKILSDHKLGDNAGREQELLEKIKELEEIIKHSKQYQQSLEEKILEDHNSIEYNHNSSMELVKKLKGQEETIKHLKEYQEGLQQKILEDHQEILKQNELKNSLKEMQDTIRQQKQYQQGLEEKILQDHQIIEKIDLTGGLKKSQKRKQSEQDPHIHGICQRQKNELEYKIQQLEFDLMRLSEENKDEELLTLQKQIDSKDLYIQQLQTNLKQNEKQVSNLEERIAELTAYKQQNERKIQGQIEESPDEIAFQTVIRIIEAKSAESEGDAGEKIELMGSCSVEKQSVSKSMISQPPSIREKNDLAEMSDDLSHKSNSQKRSEDDNSPNKLMIIDELELAQPKPKPTSQLHRFRSVQMNNQAHSNPLSVFLNIKDPSNNKTTKLSEQNTKRIGDLQAQLKDKQAQIQTLSKEVKENESKALKLDSQNKFYQKRIKDLESVKQTPIQGQQNKKDSYIRELEGIVEEYEQKIKILKSKQMKIQEALAIIEEESYKIVGELNQKEKQCEQLKNQILRKDKQIEQNGSSHDNLQPVEIVKSSPEDIEQINRLTKQNSELKDNIAKALAKLSTQDQQIKKYEQALTQISQVEGNKAKLQQENKASKEKIAKLQVELKQVNDQLLTSKRLVGKLRQSKQPKNSSQIMGENNLALVEENKNLKKKIQELEEEMFSYQANENQKDIEIETFRGQVIMLQQQVERSKNNNQPVSRSAQKQSKVVAQNANIKTENQELKTVIEILKADNQHLQEKANNAENLKKQEVEGRQQKIKGLQNQVSKLETLMKTERLEYFNKRRQFNQQREELEMKSRQLQTQLDNIKVVQNELRTNLTNKEEELASVLLRGGNNEQEVDKIRSELSQMLHQLQEKKEELSTKSNLVDLFENRILYLENEISNKDKEIKLLNEELANSSNNVDILQMKEMQNQLNFYSEELALVTKKWEELEPIYKTQKDKIENLQKVIEELNSELQLSHQQNQFNQQKLLKSIKAENKQAYEAKSSECDGLKKKLQEISEQLNFMKESHQAIEKANLEKITELEQKYKMAETQRQKAVEQLEEKQMEHMNTELDLHLKLREKNEKSQLAIGSSLTDNQYKKSLNGSQQVGTGINDLIPASKILKQLINNRSNRALAEKQIEVMVIRITQLEEQVYGASAATKEKGLILEKARLISMEFSKIKVNVMKSKMPSEERMKFLTSLKPFQSSIKDILNLSEIYSENLLTADLTNENISRS